MNAPKRFQFLMPAPAVWVLAAAAGSTLLVAGAFLFQALGYAPCKMCYWQRYPHWIAIIAGLCALGLGGRLFMVIGALATATTGAIGVFHSGVEQKWWDGPSSCSGGSALTGLSGGDLLSTDTIDKVVMCDEISWMFIGLSMPTWNAILSFVILGIWIKALMQD
ncbi:MAG: disulfide bond formation protein B [Planktomarina sp.]